MGLAFGFGLGLGFRFGLGLGLGSVHLGPLGGSRFTPWGHGPGARAAVEVHLAILVRVVDHLLTHPLAGNHRDVRRVISQIRAEKPRMPRELCAVVGALTAGEHPRVGFPRGLGQPGVESRSGPSQQCPRRVPVPRLRIAVLGSYRHGRLTLLSAPTE